MRVKQGYGGLDRFRLIAAVLVIAIHTSPLLSFWEAGDFFLTRVLARVAVPFFLMVTGQFLLGRQVEEKKRISKFLRENLLLYGIAVLLYLPIGIYAGHYRELTVGKLLRMLVFDGSFYHLWYFPACLLGVPLVYMLEQRLGRKGAGITSAVLYGIGLLGDSYYGLIVNVPVLSELYEWFFQVCSYTRNGLFLAPLFLLLGACLGERRNEERRNKGRRDGEGEQNVLEAGRDRRIRYLALAASFLLMTLEAFLLRYWKLPRHDSMYLFLPAVMWFLYPVLLEWGGSPSRGIRKLAAWMYLLHPAMIVVVRGAAKATNTSAFLIDNSMIHFAVVTALSAAAAWAVSMSLTTGRQFCRNRCREENTVSFLQGSCRRNGQENQNRKAVRTRAWIELDRAALRRNVEFLTSRLTEGCELMPAVKAEAYGHGAVLIAKELSRLGIQAFCVASAEEGITLRKNGIKGEILILGYTHPRLFPSLARWDLTQTVVDYSYARLLERYGKGISVQIGVDTGMHRLGERSEHSKLIGQMFQMFRMGRISVKGIFTHLCAADTMGEQEQAFTKKQVERFYQVLEALQEQGIRCPKFHMQSSYGVLHYPELGGDYARIGIALYGVLSTKKDTEQWKEFLSPVLSLKARVATVKELGAGEAAGYGLQFVAGNPAKLAVLTIGYADGVPRSLGKGVGSVLIRGKRAPIAGLICMDQTLVDVTGIAGVRAGDEAVLIGRSGEEEIFAGDLAEQAGTITNEILSRLGARLERIVVER